MAQNVDSDGPSAVEVERLVHLKREQEKHLSAISNRIRHLQTAERKVWKEITEARNGCLKRQEAQLRHQSEGVEEMQRVHEEQRRRAELNRAVLAARATRRQHRQVALQATQERKAQMGRDGRVESNRLQRLLERDSDQRKVDAFARAEGHRRERAQAKLRRQVVVSEKSNEAKLRNAARTYELEETLAQVANHIKQAEEEEMACVTRLQNSQAVRDSLIDEAQMVTSNVLPLTPHKAMGSATVHVPSKGVARGQSMPDVKAQNIPPAERISTGRSPVGTPGTPKSPPTRTRGVAPASPPSKSRQVHPSPPSPPSRSRPLNSPAVNSGSFSARGIPSTPTISSAANSGSLSARGIRSTPTPRAPTRSRSAQHFDNAHQAAMNGGYDELVNIQSQMSQLQRRYDSKLRQVQGVANTQNVQQGAKPSPRIPVSKAPSNPRFTPPARTSTKGRGQPISGEASTAVSSEDADEPEASQYTK